RDEFAWSPGAAGWQVSNPPVLAAAPLLESLSMFTAAGLAALRAKSVRLTGFMHEALLSQCGESIEVITGSDPAQRGCQLSVRVRGGTERARAIYAQLGARHVIADWREPDTIRLAPV